MIDNFNTRSARTQQKSTILSSSKTKVTKLIAKNKQRKKQSCPWRNCVIKILCCSLVKETTLSFPFFLSPPPHFLSPISNQDIHLSAAIDFLFILNLMLCIAAWLPYWRARVRSSLMFMHRLHAVAGSHTQHQGSKCWQKYIEKKKNYFSI